MRHCGSVLYLRERSAQSASLLNSPQTGTFHYLSTFLHIHSIGLQQEEEGGSRGGGRQAQDKRLRGMLVRGHERTETIEIEQIEQKEEP